MYIDVKTQEEGIMSFFSKFLDLVVCNSTFFYKGYGLCGWCELLYMSKEEWSLGANE